MGGRKTTGRAKGGPWLKEIDCQGRSVPDVIAEIAPWCTGKRAGRRDHSILIKGLMMLEGSAVELLRVLERLSVDTGVHVTLVDSSGVSRQFIRSSCGSSKLEVVESVGG